ncbi:hypothetical protein L1887_21108 [Cichorium endivia]|nr:hypothetical protein L1887_21108 [Cichorium endivia]
MEEVVWCLEFALLQQEGSVKTVGEVVPENQELPFLRRGEVGGYENQELPSKPTSESNHHSLFSDFAGEHHNFPPTFSLQLSIGCKRTGTTFGFIEDQQIV